MNPSNPRHPGMNISGTLTVPVALFGAVLASGALSILNGQEALVGRFGSGARALVFSAGRYAFEAQGRVMVEGAARAENGRLELTDDGGPGLCREGTGRYAFRLLGDTLRFTLVEDPCAGRRNALPSAMWVRVREALLLTHATVIDGTGGPPRGGMTLVLRDGRIAAMYPDGAEAPPADVLERDLRGEFVLPGLIDAHVHLATVPSGADRRDRVERRLRNALLGGVLAVRDMGGDARALADLARAAQAGDIVSPEIRYGAILAGPEFFDDPRVKASSAGREPGSAPWARAITRATDLRQVIAEARGTGASAVKLYADLDAALARRVAVEAHRQGLQVWSHLVLVPARPSEVVQSGTDVVSHAIFAVWEVAPLPDFHRRVSADLTVSPDHPAVQRLFALMRERGVILDATLVVGRADPNAADTSYAKRRERRAAEFVRAAHAAGVRIAAGTDGMGSDADGALPNLHTELMMLVEGAGLTPMEALVAATRTAAEAAGIGDTHGTIAVGKTADLLVLRADPTADIRNTRQISAVIRRGKVVER
ncbi:MAG: amidohydrolase family protein [Gemmatimonadales bacterium]